MSSYGTQVIQSFVKCYIDDDYQPFLDQFKGSFVLSPCCASVPEMGIFSGLEQHMIDEIMEIENASGFLLCFAEGAYGTHVLMVPKPNIPGYENPEDACYVCGRAPVWHIGYKQYTSVVYESLGKVKCEHHALCTPEMMVVLYGL